MRKIFFLLIILVGCQKPPVYKTDRNMGVTFQQVNVGASANDHTGDPLRTAFIKQNDNWTLAQNSLNNIYSETQTRTLVNDSLNQLRADATELSDWIGVFNVLNYGATGDGTTDDTQAIKDAITAAPSYSVIYFPAGVYKITSTVTFNHGYTTVMGVGKGATRISFEPASDEVCFKFSLDDPADVLYYCEIKDLEFVTSADTKTKIALEVWHTTGFSASNIYISNFCTTVNKNSIGIHWNGHESGSFNNITIWADRPVFIDNYWGCDHVSFTDCLFIGSTADPIYPLIGVADDMDVSDLSFNGRQAWAGGTGGFYFKNTVGTNYDINEWSFNNVRWEQGDPPTAKEGWAIDISSASTMRDFSFNNFYQAGDKGIKLSNVNRVLLNNVRLLTEANDTSIYLADDVTNVTINNASFGTYSDVYSRTPAYSTNLLTIKKIIGHPGDTRTDFNFTSAANTDPQNLDLGAIIPARARVIAVEMICLQTATVVDLAFKVGNASAGEQFIASASCAHGNDVIGIIDATKPAAVIMDWWNPTHIWVQGVITTTLWNAVSAGKWVIFITCQNYDNPYDPAIQ